MTKDNSSSSDRKDSAPQLFNNFLNKIKRKPSKSGSSVGKYAQAPLMDLIERKNEIVLKADIPGVLKKDIVLEIQDRVLTISAECVEDEEHGHFIRRERYYKFYEGGIHIPVEIDEEKAVARLSNGVLTVTLPKKNIDKSSIEIK